MPYRVMILSIPRTKGFAVVRSHNEHGPMVQTGRPVPSNRYFGEARLNAYERDCLPESLSTRSLTMPTSRRQNIITNPATAANTEASGIRVSGPMYKRRPPI